MVQRKYQYNDSVYVYIEKNKYIILFEIRFVMAVDDGKKNVRLRESSFATDLEHDYNIIIIIYNTG